MTDHWWNPVLRIYTIYINYMPDNISASNGCWAIITWKNILIISMGPLVILQYASHWSFIDLYILYRI